MPHAGLAVTVAPGSYAYQAKHQRQKEIERIEAHLGRVRRPDGPGEFLVAYLARLQFGRPMAAKILCFGDSNTWGYVPSLDDPEVRFGPETRWTGVLQSLLGSRATVIEEGLNSRTTDLDYPDVAGKNGLAALPGVLATHAPIHTFVVLLGSNDLKQLFGRSPQEIAGALERVIQAALASQEPSPGLLVLSPPIPLQAHVYDSFRYEGLEIKARALAPLYRELAVRYGGRFVDLAAHIVSSKVDGVHLDPSEHRKIATLVRDNLALTNS
jgi:lysophospholipase L1-like esterase